MQKLLFWVLGVVICVGLDKNIASLRADFVQYAQNSQGEGGVYYSGSLVALAPYDAKWEYQTPIQKIVYLKKGELISYEPLLSQVVYLQTNQSINFLKIIQRAKQSPKDSNLYLANVDGKEYALIVKNAIPQRLEYDDELGNHMVIELKNVQLNPKIPSKEFDFNPPKGVDIIRH